MYLNPKNPVYQTDYNNVRILIDDKLFEGQKAKIDFLSSSNALSEDYEGEVYFTLKSVSKSHYLFHSTFGLQRWNEGDPFAQPVQIYTNIQNGLGIVTAQSGDTYQFK